jgi:predicted CXXCH cytochrome family protein
VGDSYFRRGSFHRTLRAGVAVLGLAAFTGGCVDEDTVYNDRPFGDDPPASAGGMLGYLQGQAGETTCAQCHATPSATWATTAHADAWEGLQGSGHAQEFCEACHAVSELGNAETAPVGWTATADARYHDVQCESCHGPGEMHVADPEATQPIPSLAVGADLTNGCGECHNGTHHPFVEQWELSKHSEVIGFAASRVECASCHRGQGTLLAWGVRSNYAERDSEEPLAVVCGVCHSMHDATFEGQLRFPVNTPDVQVHLCARCHNRRSIPDPNSSHGLAPHSPETELLVGEAGWIPPGADLDYGAIVASHGTQNNERLCATCHVASYTVTDEATGEFVFEAVGHTFQAIPCVDSEGIPNGETDCAITTAARSFVGCVDSGCHSSEDGAAAILNFRGDFVAQRAATLLAQLEVVDPNLDEPGGEIDASNSTFTVAEGAFFNYNLATHLGDVYGSTTHNGPWIRALLDASITAVQDEYGVAPPAP